VKDSFKGAEKKLAGLGSLDTGQLDEGNVGYDYNSTTSPTRTPRPGIGLESSPAQPATGPGQKKPWSRWKYLTRRIKGTSPREKRFSDMVSVLHLLSYVGGLAGFLFVTLSLGALP